jgi:hypothetical protein
MVPEVPDFRTRGTSGQLEIKALLSRFSNPMDPAYDLGLDFHCEFLENKKASGIFFWVQAKATEKFTDCWREYIKKDTIVLWLKQQSPVFVLLLETTSDHCYWLSVEDKRDEWLKKMNDKNATIEVVINRQNLLEKNGENGKFFDTIKRDLILTNANYGIPHMIGEGYVRHIPALRLSDEAVANLRGNIRLGFDYLIYDLLIKQDPNQAYHLARLLCEFDRGHYDHFLVLARICRLLGKRGEARDNYNISIGICKDDPNWNKWKKPEDASIEEIIAEIQKELNGL